MYQPDVHILRRGKARRKFKSDGCGIISLIAVLISQARIRATNSFKMKLQRIISIANAKHSAIPAFLYCRLISRQSARIIQIAQPCRFAVAVDEIHIVRSHESMKKHPYNIKFYDLLIFIVAIPAVMRTIPVILKYFKKSKPLPAISNTP